MPDDPHRRIFTLDEARELLPMVRRLTDEAVQRADELGGQLQGLDEDDPLHARLEAELSALIAGWAERVQELQVEVKGLWLVDFDNGEGYYCWRYPEETIGHFHGYAEGFGGRMKIM